MLGFTSVVSQCRVRCAVLYINSIQGAMRCGEQMWSSRVRGADYLTRVDSVPDKSVKGHGEEVEERCSG
jgi:hypothetical protein